MIRVIVCRVGQRPVIETLAVSVDRGHLRDMQAIVGGLVTVVSLDDGLDLWCNDEGLLLGLPLNRVLPAVAPEVPEGWDLIAVMGENAAAPGEPGEWRIHGDFFLAREDGRGGLASVTDADIEKYMRLFASEDPRSAEEMDRVRDRLRAWD